MTIEVFDGSLVTSARDWRALRPGSGDAPTDERYLRFLREDHHQLYGRPWSIGRSYFEFIKSHITPAHNVLDFGCGAGRLGVWLIPFLDRDRYVGVDHHWEALDAFARYEILLHDLQGKDPRLVLDGSCEISVLEEQFDVIIDCYVSFHMDDASRLALFREYSKALQPGGRIFIPHEPKLTEDQMAGLGLSISRRQMVRLKHLEGHLPEKKITDYWHIISLAA